MDKFLNPDFANALQMRSILLELIGFILVYLELFHEQKARSIQNTIREITTLQNILKFISKDDLEIVWVKKLFKHFFKENFDFAILIFKLSITIIIITICVWFFGLFDSSEMLFCIIFSPMLSLGVMIGSIPVLTFIRRDEEDSGESIGIGCFFFLVFGVISIFFYDNSILEYVEGVIVLVAMATIFMIALKTISKLLFYLDKGFPGKALGAFGFFISGIGLALGAYQVAVLLWA